jgi:hypothetical protein
VFFTFLVRRTHGLPAAASFTTDLPNSAPQNDSDLLKLELLLDCHSHHGSAHPAAQLQPFAEKGV